MAAFIVLDDGRILWRSNLTLSSLYYLIANEVPTEYQDLKRWLIDMSNRPAPFLDIDIRGLEPEYRKVFYSSAQAAQKKLDQREPKITEGSAEALSVLLKMKESIDNGEPPLSLSDDNKVHEFSVEFTVDLNEIWFTDQE